MSNEILDLAVEAAHSAGSLLLDRFRQPAEGVEAKTTPTDLVSDADKAAEALILDLIGSKRPDDGVLSEEGGGGSSSSGLTWVVDPLDGTVNFLFEIPVWSVSIAVEDDKGGLVGVVHHPSTKETFTATRGGGSHLNGLAIHVSERTDISSALVGTGFAYDARARAVQAEIATRVLPKARDIRRAGSAALDLAALACGRLDAFYEAPMERWDKAAGILLITEAGGVVTPLEAPFDLSPGVVAGNQILHDQLRDLIEA
ncbi:MAG: monophosphatase [Actinomycetota bacterium]|nr:monophosphatase [Actinomycetota bacterium]